MMKNNLIVISDPHCGCQFGLCPSEGVRLDGGGWYAPSRYQRQVWAWWQEFWSEWVPTVTRGEPFSVVVNGDATDGRHHRSVTQVSQNESDQARIAEQCLAPVVELCEGDFYLVRGTEAHVGPSAENEERLAKSLGATPDSDGNYSRYELWLRIGGKCLCHLSHHIGTTGATHYESTAVMKELAEAFTEAGRWRDDPPDVVVRSHRHRGIEIKIPTARDYGISFTTPGWQLKTPFVYKIPGGRAAPPQFGGSLVRQGDEEFYARHRIWSLPRRRIVEA